jgi:hypothetical protein
MTAGNLKPEGSNPHRLSLMHWLLLLSPVLVCVAIMLPRLLSPQFGLLDDGSTLFNAYQVQQHVWNPGGEAVKGRFRPAYWLYYVLIDLIFNANPFAFFFGHLVIFAATTAGLIVFIRLVRGSSLQAWVAGMLYAAAGPCIENYYTLSKGEPLQMLAIVLSLLLLLVTVRARRVWQKGLAFSGMIVTLFLANISKETSLMMIPISLGWLVMALLYRKFHIKPSDLLPRGLYFGATAAAGAIYFILRSRYVHVSLLGGTYTSRYNFTLRGVLSSGLNWSGWILRDFSYLLPLLLFLAVSVLIYRRHAELPDLIDILIWLVGWIGVFLSWYFIVEYYLLGFAMGCAVMGGLLVEAIYREINSPSKAGRNFARVCLALSVLLFLTTIPNNVSNAQLQLTEDWANTEMVKFLAKETPENGTVLVNLPESNQYIKELNYQLIYLEGRQDIQVDAFTPKRMDIVQAGKVGGLIVSPDIKNQPPLSVRLGLYEDGAKSWNKKLQEALPPGVEPELVIKREFRQFNIDFITLLCPIVNMSSYCSKSAQVVDRRVLTYWWYIFPMQAKSP